MTGLAAERSALKQAEARRSRLRPRRFDDLGLRQGLAGTVLPGLVAAMAFLAALACAGAVGAAHLATTWQAGAARSLTVQIPDPAAPAPDGTARQNAAARALSAAPGVAAADPLSLDQLSALLRPWLGPGAATPSLALPAVFAVRLAPDGSAAALAAALTRAVPGALVEDPGIWARRLHSLAGSLQWASLLAVTLVAAIAAAVVAVATRAGLAARREAIEIVHGLGATDAYIAARFSARVLRLTLLGGAIGALCALPVLAGLAALAAPFGTASAAGAPPLLPLALWLALPALPLLAGAIGWATAQITVRRWLLSLA